MVYFNAVFEKNSHEGGFFSKEKKKFKNFVIEIENGAPQPGVLEYGWISLCKVTP